MTTMTMTTDDIDQSLRRVCSLISEGHTMATALGEVFDTKIEPTEADAVADRIEWLHDNAQSAIEVLGPEFAALFAGGLTRQAPQGSDAERQREDEQDRKVDEAEDAAERAREDADDRRQDEQADERDEARMQAAYAEKDAACERALQRKH